MEKMGALLSTCGCQHETIKSQIRKRELKEGEETPFFLKRRR